MTARQQLRVLVFGCGLMGSIRAREAAAHARTHLAAVCDPALDKAVGLSETYGGQAFSDWQDALLQVKPDIAVVCTPNRLLMPIAMAALEMHAHVLIEKPMGRNLSEATRMAAAAEHAGTILKVGFNHRYHPACRRSHQLLMNGSIGAPLFVRCVYGHGGRPGLETEWRADPQESGGGELLDQGVHALDLLNLTLGSPVSVYADLATLAWPIAPVEDNAFALFRYEGGQRASLHASWSQWINRFQWQVYGDQGALEIDGLGGSYGVESLTVYHRKPDGGAPTRQEETFPGPDLSWAEEWSDFVAAIETDRQPEGHAREGVEVMRVLEALYRSAADGRPCQLSH